VIAICKADSTNAAFTHSTSSDGCTDYLRTESKSACYTFDLTSVLNYFEKVKPFAGAILALLGIALWWKGYFIFEFVQGVGIGVIIWVALFGVVYNVYPAANQSLTVILVMAGVTLVLAIILAVVVAKFFSYLIWYILIGTMFAGLAVFIIGLFQLNKPKIVAIGSIVGFIAGVAIQCLSPNTIASFKAAGLTFLGSFLFFFGISLYVGGFHKTKWTVYVYAVLIILAGFLRVKYSMNDAGQAQNEELKKNTSDAFDADGEACTGAMNS